MKGTLRYLGYKDTYQLLITHPLIKNLADSDFYKYETKHYFSLDDGEVFPGVVTFTKVRKRIMDSQVDTLGENVPEEMDEKMIEIVNFSRREHHHLGRFPEIYPYDYRIIKEESVDEETS